MKQSKQEVEIAVIRIGDLLNIGGSVRELLISTGIHQTIKEVVYKAFVDNEIEYFEKDNDTFEAYQLIRTFCKETAEYGKVVFNVPYKYLNFSEKQ